MGDLQRPLASLELSAVLRWEVPDLAEAFALPPVRVRGVDDRDLVSGLQVKLIGMTRLEVVQDHIQIGR